MSTSKYLKNVSDLLLSDKKIDMMELYYNLNMKKAKLKKENGLPKLNNATDALYHMFAQ